MFDRLRRAYAAFQKGPEPTKEFKSAREHLQDFRLALRASYDSVARTPENSRHWQWADHLAADASLNPGTRIAIRSQARYECQENNSYGRGMAETLVADTIGTGPRLQVGEFSESVNSTLEEEFHRWAAAVDLRSKLATMRRAKLIDGEVVARFINNLTVDNPVSLDLQLIECDQLRSPRFETELSEDYVDGVRLDRFGNPIAYDILRHHPGSRYWTPTDYFAYDTYPQEQIIHLYRADRPGQHRGVSEFAPALPLFAFLRRFTLATISAAETAANVSQVVVTDAPIPEELEEEYAASNFEKYMDAIPVDRNSATVLPNQWDLKQFAAEHPATTYNMFKREIVGEIGRVIGMPVNLATGDSGESNFSSAKFDWLAYERLIKIEQEYLGKQALDRILSQWLVEASLTGVLPQRVANRVITFMDRYGMNGLSSYIKHSWAWQGMRDADAEDAAQAQRMRLQNGSTHRAREYAEQGRDVMVEDKLAAESFGLTLEQYHELVRVAVFTNGNIIETGSEETPAEAPTETPAETEETEEAAV